MQRTFSCHDTKVNVTLPSGKMAAKLQTITFSTIFLSKDWQIAVYFSCVTSGVMRS